jgi:hypothetical protein
MLLLVMEREVKKLLDAQIVVPLRYSEWVANLVPVRKKMKEGKLLGHIVSAEGVRIDPIRVEAIHTLSLPRSRKEV